MRTYHPIQWVEQIRWHEILTDSRFWAGVAVVVFVALFTALVILAAQSGANTATMPYNPVFPYGPYGPIPMP